MPIASLRVAKPRDGSPAKNCRRICLIKKPSNLIQPISRHLSDTGLIKTKPRSPSTKPLSTINRNIPWWWGRKNLAHIKAHRFRYPITIISSTFLKIKKMASAWVKHYVSNPAKNPRRSSEKANNDSNKIKLSRLAHTFKASK